MQLCVHANFKYYGIALRSGLAIRQTHTSALQHMAHQDAISSVQFILYSDIVDS
jgi:hypothetical protein